MKKIKNFMLHTVLNILSLFNLFAVPVTIERSVIGKDIKVLVLIVDSDNLPVYKEFRKIWRSYMNDDPSHIEAYFIRGDNNLNQEYKIDKDIIWVKTQESWRPGMINKTVMSLEVMQPRFHEFDYILRTNLSSFYVFNNLISVLQNMPREKFVMSKRYGNENGYLRPHGSGYIISTDIANDIIRNKSLLMNSKEADDEQMGRFFDTQDYNYYDELRIDIHHYIFWDLLRNQIPVNTVHFRVKMDDPNIRLAVDVPIQRQLLSFFYNKQV